MKEKNEWFVIDDIEKFIESTRVLVYSSFGDNKTPIDEYSISVEDLDDEEKIELDKCLSQSESMVISQTYLQSIKSKKNKIKYKISTKLYMSLIESLNTRMISNMLQKLTSDGVLETAYDEQLNDFIFWVKDNETDSDSKI